MAPLGPFDAERRVAVAVSGGADSLALALLLAGWGRPLALVVDHGLRPGSTGEAAVTLRRLAALGIPARLLHAHLQPGPALAERARSARYALLAGACRDAGLADLLLGHHLRDQAETLLLRRAGGSGPAGLAAMALVAYADAVRLLRPLLAIQPDRLRATLRQAGAGWVEDPTNADPATPRARLRAGPLRDPGLAAQLATEAARHGTVRAAGEAADATSLAAVAIHPEGYAHVTAPLSPSGLSALVWTLSGAAHPPSPQAVARFDAGLHPGTLHGVRIAGAGRLGPGWLIAREAAAMEPPVPACERWDGRYRLAGPAPDGAELGELGADAARLRHLSPLPSFVLRTLPTLRKGGAIISVPHLCYPDASACRSVPLLFCPARPAAAAPFRVV